MLWNWETFLTLLRKDGGPSRLLLRLLALTHLLPSPILLSADSSHQAHHLVHMRHCIKGQLEGIETSWTEASLPPELSEIAMKSSLML